MKNRRKEDRRKEERRSCYVEPRRFERRKAMGRRVNIVNRRVYNTYEL